MFLITKMEIDHIIIFSKNQGKEADELVKFGLVEGSNRVHPGQGTRNRKFYFKNFFLEVVWVWNEEEIKSEKTALTGLWERANYWISGYSPFGICLAKTWDIDDLFENSIKYKPVYLPEGFSFDIITNNENPTLPWTCRLPFTDPPIHSSEPTKHPAGINRFTKVRLGIPQLNIQNDFTDFLSHQSTIEFELTEFHHLTLEFDYKRNGKIKKFRNIPLTIDF